MCLSWHVYSFILFRISSVESTYACSNYISFNTTIYLKKKNSLEKYTFSIKEKDRNTVRIIWRSLILQYRYKKEQSRKVYVSLEEKPRNTVRFIWQSWSYRYEIFSPHPASTPRNSVREESSLSRSFYPAALTTCEASAPSPAPTDPARLSALLWTDLRAVYSPVRPLPRPILPPPPGLRSPPPAPPEAFPWAKYAVRTSQLLCGGGGERGVGRDSSFSSG